MQSKNLIINILIYRLMKNDELLKKSMPVSQPVSAEPLLITTTKSNGKYKQRFQHLIQITSIREIPIEQNKRVQTKIKEIIYNNLYDTLVEELKDTISRFKAQYNIQEINPYISDILQNPEDLISRSNNKEYR